jgi:uncharacterized damage-inducible protein DinB
MDAPYLLRRLARSNLLANVRLHRACAALPPGAWEAPRVAFFPSLKATLNHILVIDRFYLDAVQGGTLGAAAWADPVPCSTLDDLVQQQSELDRLAVAICDGLAPGDVDRACHIHRSGRVQVETLGDTLLHLFLHDQHHRGQAHAMVSGTSVKPPQLDEFFMDDDAAVRADDLQAAGWDEAYLRG